MTRTMVRTLGIAALVLAAPLTVQGQVVQEWVDLDVVDRIRDEGLNRSRVPELASYLTDVIGPRLTGSPGMMRANEWTAEKLEEWGFDNVVVEPWGEFGRGWENVSVSLRALAPYSQTLEAWPVAWTGDTGGETVTGPVVIVEVEDESDIDQYRGTLEGAFVLTQPYREIAPEYEPRDRRRDLDWLLERPEETPREMAEEQRAERERMIAEWRARRALSQKVDEMLLEEGVAGKLSPSGWTYGIIRIGGTGAYRTDTPIPAPELIIAHEDYGQLYRNVERELDVELALNVENRWHDDDLQGYNTLGDFSGTDLADEFVLIGGHLDSWHAGTGATDNAAGTVVMMEAMRILKSLGLQPRRTIRIALWSGEEQGLHGSRNWVSNNPELHDRISGYLNFDNGTGRIRGIYAQSNPHVVPIFEQLLFPFRDLGVVAVKPGDTGGTDHLAFDRNGIPGFQFVQDPIEYSIRTHHSNIDTYERLVLDDLKQAAVVVASLAYHLAMRDEMLPRKAEPAVSGR